MQTTFAIEGMFCGGCAHTVERSLLKIAGVNSASVSFVSDMGVVEYDDRETDPTRIWRTIRRLGYRARDLSEVSENTSRSDRYLFALQRRILVAVGFGMWVMIFSMVGYVGEPSSANANLVPAILAAALSLPVIIYSGWPYLKLAWRSVLVGAPGMELLISVAAIVAVGLSVSNLLAGIPTVYADTAVMLITFQLFARVSDFKVRRKAQDAVREQIELAPSVARVSRDGIFREVHIADIKPGELVRCRAGEVVPIDGSVVLGRGHVDLSHLTGESKYRVVAPGDRIEAGSICSNAMLDICVEGSAANRVIEQLSKSVRVTLAQKSDLMRLADRVAGWLLPAIFTLALATFAIANYSGEATSIAAARALAVLVVTCPCALALAVPLAISAAVRAAAKNGFILRDPGVLEDDRPIDFVLLDKTGTLTEEDMQVVQTQAVSGLSAADVLQWAALAEQASSHPIAKSIVKAAKPIIDEPALVSSSEIAGMGVMVESKDGPIVRVGSRQWVATQVESVAMFSREEGVTQVLVSLSGQLIGAIDLAPRIKSESASLIASLRKAKRRLLIVSGDEQTAVDRVARRLGVDAIGEQRPEDKVRRIRSLQQQGHRVAFIGDGLNDGPALAAADLGVAVDGASGLAKSAAAIVLVTGSIGQIGRVVGLVEKGAGIIRQNLFWALVYNAVMVPAAVVGLAGPTIAMIAMAVSSLTVSANSLRLR